MAEELKIKALMDKLYECGKFYKPNIAVGLIKDNYKKNLTEEDDNVMDFVGFFIRGKEFKRD